MVGLFAAGAVVLVLRAATSCVTNAALNVGVTVLASSNVGWTNGVDVSATTVGGIGDEVGTAPPSGVGVVYCPHSAAFPPQDTIKKEAVIRKTMSRFTKQVRWMNYTCIE